MDFGSVDVANAPRQEYMDTKEASGVKQGRSQTQTAHKVPNPNDEIFL